MNPADRRRARKNARAELRREQLEARDRARSRRQLDRNEAVRLANETADALMNRWGKGKS